MVVPSKPNQSKSETEKSTATQDGGGVRDSAVVGNDSTASSKAPSTAPKPPSFSKSELEEKGSNIAIRRKRYGNYKICIEKREK